METIKNYWKSITTVASGIVVIGGAIVVLDVEFPRPAWASEIKQLSGYVIELDNKVTSQQLDEAKLQLYRNLRERSRYDASGESAPFFLTQERVILERQIETLQSHLKSLIGTE
jgi:hypothetical protein